MKKYTCQMSISEDLEQDNGHVLVLVLERSGIQGEWDNGGKNDIGISKKADVQCSVLQVHCLEVDSNAKEMENGRYTIQPI